MLIQTALIYGILLLDLTFIIAIIFLERKNPASSIAWILLIIVLPVGGIIIYLILGNGFHINRKKRYNLKVLSDDLNDNLVNECLLTQDPAEFNEHAYGKVARYLKQAGFMGSAHNYADVFIDGESLFAQMLEDMRQAKEHIHLLYYIFRNDKLGREILGILREKAAEGVEVRVIYDSVGSTLTFGSMFKQLRKLGGEAQAFEPFFFTLSSKLRVNYRNHRKITVIDGRIGYVGGMNIGEEYLGRSKKLRPWRDTQLRLLGPAVWFLQKRFLMDWCYVSEQALHQLEMHKYFPPPIIRDDMAMQIVSSGPDTVYSPIKGGLMSMLQNASRNVYIQTPYFTPDDSFLDCLRVAVLSGLDVRIMLPGISDNLFVQQASLGYANEVARFGARVYLYHGFIHSKTITIDGEVASIGTSNIGTRSFSVNFEVNAFIYDQDFTRQHEAQFIKDMENCRELHCGEIYQRGLFYRGIAAIARLASPLM